MGCCNLGDGGNLRPVVDLLVEQIECAPSRCQVHSPCISCLVGRGLVYPGLGRHVHAAVLV